MEVKVLKSSKDEMEVELENMTIAEILRVYLNKDSNVRLAVWRRKHPTENPVLVIKGKSPKKSINDAVSAVTKDLSKISDDFSKLK